MRGTTTADGFNLALGAGFNSLAPVASPYTVMALVRVATTGSRRIFLADFSSDGVNESICMEQQAANTWRFYHADSGGSAVASTGVTVTTGWHWVELGWDGAQLQGRVDGAAMSAAAAVNPRRAGTDLRALRGGAFTSLGFDGDIAFIGIWKRFVPIVERGSIRANPWQLYQPTKRNAVFGVGGGATNYTLTASAGSYTLTGIDATLTYTPAAVNYSLTADVGAYALSGVDATLTYTVAGTAYTLSADAGAYSLTGVDATLSYVPGSGAYTLTADTGSYTLNGSDAGLTFSRRMAADVGSYTLTGVAAGLQLGRRLTADTGVYALAGVDAVLTYTSTAPIAYTLACEAGSYSLSGVDARFLVNGVGEASAHGFVLVDMPSSMWWKRKPKAITEEVAKKKIKRVVRAIEQATRAQVAQPAAQQQREVYQAIAPLLEEMPGFDWKQVFRLIVAQDTARRQMEATIARAKQIEQDDEDVLLLMLL